MWDLYSPYEWDTSTACLRLSVLSSAFYEVGRPRVFKAFRVLVLVSSWQPICVVTLVQAETPDHSKRHRRTNTPEAKDRIQFLMVRP